MPLFPFDMPHVRIMIFRIMERHILERKKFCML